ncbi:MAG: hypothetical protein ACM36B_01220 [Bacteroidota bacterium]
MTDPDPRDPDLDRAYRDTARDEPPAELDERIRAAARRAVGTRPQSLEQQAAGERRRSRTSRWRLPLSLAATVVIAATVTVMVQEEERRPRDDAGRDAAPLRVEPRAAEQPAPPAESAPAKLRSAPSATRAAPPAPKSAAEPPAPPPQPAPRPFREDRATEAQQPAAADSAPVAPGELQMRRQAPAPAASPPAAAPPPAPAPRPSTTPAQRTAPAGAASEALRRDRTLGDRPERASRESAIRSPEAWVEHIRSLRAQGREAEATTELAELRRAYPDFQLPTDLAR